MKFLQTHILLYLLKDLKEMKREIHTLENVKLADVGLSSFTRLIIGFPFNLIIMLATVFLFLDKI